MIFEKKFDKSNYRRILWENEEILMNNSNIWIIWILIDKIK